jgi:hypothetical protein
MKRISLLFLASSFSGMIPCPVPAQTEAPLPLKNSATTLPAPQASSALDQATIQEIVSLLRQNSIRKTELTRETINEAAMQGLLDRLGPAASVVDRETREKENRAIPLRFESVGHGIAWIRPGSLTRESAGEARKQIAPWKANGLSHLILDLRGRDPKPDYHGAAAWGGLFVPPQQVLFKRTQPGEERPELFLSKDDPIWTGHLVLLVDESSAGPAELLAAALNERQARLILGAPTPGLTVEYRYAPLPNGKFLRYASAEFLTAKGQSLFGKGIRPRHALTADPKVQAKLDHFWQEGGTLKQLLETKPRPRFDEAALLTGVNPEWDYLVAKSAGQPTAFDTAPLHDPVLRVAFDVLMASDFLQSPKDR